MASGPPRIFDPRRRLAASRRAAARQGGARAARFIADDMVADTLERLAFVRQEPGKSLVIGDATGTLRSELESRGHKVAPWSISEFDEERPYSAGGHDLIVSLASLDTVNDLPGALIHLWKALAPGGRAVAQFIGAGSLTNLRAAMLAADGERPAARMHPMVDVRAAAQLVERAGWRNPVVDSRSLRASYRSLDALVSDLRDQAGGSVLTSRAPVIGKTGLERARAAFLNGAGPDGRVTEVFEILTLSGRHP